MSHHCTKATYPTYPNSQTKMLNFIKQGVHPPTLEGRVRKLVWVQIPSCAMRSRKHSVFGFSALETTYGDRHMATKTQPVPKLRQKRRREEPRVSARHTPKNPDISVAFSRIKRDFKPIAEAAEEMGLSPATLRKYCQHQIFSNSQDFGREWIISQDDIDWWLANRKGKVGRPPAGE